MASTTAHPRVLGPAPSGSRPARRRRQSLLFNRAALESLVLFGVFFAGYAVIGHRVVIEQHVIVFDGLSRLAHAYFAWYNAPPKLAAIGFEWPPVMTLVFL